MKKKDNLSVVTKIFGIIITAWITFLVAIDLVKALKAGNGSFFYNASVFTQTYPYIDPNALILIYLAGYAAVWWKKLWGTVIILIVSTLGIIFSQAGDIRFHFILTFAVGFLYFLNWAYERKGNL